MRQLPMLEKLLHIFFPRRCIDCRNPGSALCDSCLRRIRYADTLPDHTFAIYDYGSSIVRRGIRAFKYYRRSEVVRVLVDASVPFINEFLGETLQSTSAQSFVFVPIPEHPRKLRVKGFNQAVVLTKWWGTAFPKSSVQEVLTKTVFTMPQARLGRSARLKNIAHTMQATRVLDPSVTYIIIDDVTTTGATFVEARRALRTAGAKKIFCIALAHGYARK